MASAEQIKALLKTHSERDEQRFYSIALQVAASEARKGHHKLADEIKTLVEKNQFKPNIAAVPSPTLLTSQIVSLGSSLNEIACCVP